MSMMMKAARARSIDGVAGSDSIVTGFMASAPRLIGPQIRVRA